jgi:hypothetical protein
MSRVRPRFENLFDPLSIIPEFQADRVGLAPQSAQSTGLEISLDHSTGSWDWWGSYTLARATDRIDGRDEPRSWDQRHALQGGMTWSNQQWTVSVAGSLHSGWPTSDLALLEAGTDPDGEPIYIARPGQRNVLRHDFFASLDFRVSRTFDVRHGTLLAFLEVTNLTNRKNPCCRDWDITEDASGNTILEHSYDYWMPLLPAVGVLWEF